MEGLEYVRNQIIKLKDDLQHYTMVEKDSALASQIRYDLEQFETIESELKAKANLVSMCGNLAKLVGLKEKDYVELETLITKKLKALEIIKNHIVNRDLDTSGVYLEYHLGLFEPYYSIEIKRGANQTITEKEYDLLKEVLK